MLKAVFLFASQLWKLRSDSHCVHDKTPHVSVFFNGQQTPANSGGLVTFVFDTKKPLYYPCLLLIEVQKWSSKTHHFDTPNTTWPWAEQSLANVWSRRQALPRSGVNICQTYRVEKDWWPQAVGWVKSHSIHSIHSTPVIHCLTWHTIDNAVCNVDIIHPRVHSIHSVHSVFSVPAAPNDHWHTRESSLLVCAPSQVPAKSWPWATPQKL